MGAGVRPESSGYSADNPFAKAATPKAAPAYSHDNPFANAPAHPAPTWGGAESAIDGFTVGFAPKIAAGLDALGEQLTPGGRSFGDAYTAQRDGYTAAHKQYAAEHPKMDAGMNVAGGVASALVGGSAVRAAKAAALAGDLGSGAASVARAFPAARAATPAAGGAVSRALKTIGARALQGAEGGAAFGAAQGVGNATGGLGDYLESGVRGAAQGALGGAVAGPVLGPVANRVGRGLGAIGRGLGLGGEEAVANSGADLLARKIEQGGTTPQALLDSYRSGATPADAPIVEAGGRQVARLARGVRAVGGQGATTIDDAFAAHRAGQRPRVEAALKTGLGLPDVPNEVAHAEQLAEARRVAGAPLYQAAYQGTPEVQHPDLEAALQTPLGRQAQGFARQLMEQRGVPMTTRAVQTQQPVVFQGVPLTKPDGTPMTQTVTTHEPVRSLEYVHYVRQALDKMKQYPNAFTASGPTGEEKSALTAWQGEIGTLRNRLTGILHGASDPFAQADATWGDHSSHLRAFDAGQQFRSATPGEVAHNYPQQPAPAQEQYRLGALVADKHALGTTDRGYPVERVWTGDNAQSRYQTLMGQNFAPFKSTMERERAGNALNSFVTGGSQTMDKGADAGELVGGLDPHTVSAALSAMHGNPNGMAHLLVRNAAKVQALRIGQDRGNWLAPRLVGQDAPSVLEEILRRRATTSPPPGTAAAAGAAYGTGEAITPAHRP